MKTILFIGTVLPDTVRISSPRISVKLDAGPDTASGSVTVQVTDNRVIASFETFDDISDVACATMRNIVQDIASSACDSAALLEGAWTVVTIDTCLNIDGSIRMRFSNASHVLKNAFQEHSVTSKEIDRINRHPEGFSLRLALDDLNAGLMEMKFIRSHFYRAVESLRNSVAPIDVGADSSKCWEVFRTALDIERTHIALIPNQAERHGDYVNASQLSGQEVEAILQGIADIISRYVRWFNTNKFAGRIDEVA